MSHALARSGTTETKWTVISGAMSGSVRLMNTAPFTVGRSPENEFVIVNDPKCSRKHASVEWTANGCEITALSAANPIFVNDKEVERAILQDGDVVTLGDTKIQFNLTTGTEESSPSYASGHTQIALVEPAAVAMPARSYAQPMVARPPRAKCSSRVKKNNSGRLVFYFVIGIVVLFFMLPDKKKKDAQTLRTEQKIEADIAEANKLQEAEENSPERRKRDESVTARQAQENYVRGFRDFRKGQYERSLDSFQACLALDPSHGLCARYLRLAQRKFSEIVQYDIILGRKYREQNQYKACRASFRNVMVMVKDANSSAYKEAKANYDACNSKVEGRF